MHPLRRLHLLKAQMKQKTHRTLQRTLWAKEPKPKMKIALNASGSHQNTSSDSRRGKGQLREGRRDRTYRAESPNIHYSKTMSQPHCSAKQMTLSEGRWSTHP